MIEDRQHFSERRSHPRFATRSGIYVRFTTYSTRIGEVKEMSLGGLSFEYPESATEVGEPAELDLLSDVGDAYLGKIPFETVSDLRVAPDKALDTGSRRRCSVKFTALTPKQQARLKTFVAGAAVDPRAVSFC